VKKALLAAAVAVAAVAGVIVALVVSAGGEKKPAQPVSSSAQTAPASTTGPATTGGTGGTRATTDTTPEAIRRATAPVDTTTVRLPPPPAPTSSRRRTLIVGVVDDALAQRSWSFARAQAEVSRDAGFDAAIVSATWKRGQRRPPARLVRVLRNVAAATKRADMRLFVLVWHGFARDTPRTPSERADFAAFAAAVVKALPTVRHVIVGNEPNLDTFWKPQFGGGGRDLAAVNYTDLLARSYDAIKSVDSEVRVLGGSLSPRGADRPNGSRLTHSPTAFIRDLGAAYRASGRNRPLMDAFAVHPYMQASRISPAVSHAKNTSITLADYPKLVALLNEAFKRTNQRGATLPLYYTEFGVQTPVPANKLRFYSDHESPERTDSVGFEQQAAYYRRALELAFCQPTVRGLFVFHTFDEADFAGWQSGLYFADRTPKPSLTGFKSAVSDLRNGKLPNCSR
jgi:hypothetical protein